MAYIINGRRYDGNEKLSDVLGDGGSVEVVFVPDSNSFISTASGKCVDESFLRSLITVIKSSSSKLESIKVVRCLTGWGLREAKDFVESLY